MTEGLSVWTSLPEHEGGTLISVKLGAVPVVSGSGRISKVLSCGYFWYIVARQDHAINPDLERFFAKRMKAKVTELDSSHIPFISQPSEVIKIIEGAAKSLS